MRLPFLIGNTHRLSKEARNLVAALRGRTFAPELVCDPELAARLAQLAHVARRGVGVLLSRNAHCAHVLLGRNWPELEATLQRRRDGRPCGLRLVLVYDQPEAYPTDADLELLEGARLDLLVTLGHRRGQVTEAWVSSAAGSLQLEGPFDLETLGHLRAADRIRAVEEASRGAPSGSERPERAVLVGLVVPGRGGYSDPESLEELRRLAETAGAEVVDVLTQERPRPDPATLIGRGKVGELRALVEREAADLVVFDEELTPAQQRNLEEELGVKVVDRTALVLDIFARRARTREGRLQVELAQMTYLLPRLVGKGVLLSRLGGGIGTRGPGETQLETDRRRVRRRVDELRGRIEEVARARRTQRRARQQAEVPVVALVGYTNAGKSTLLNALSGAQVFVEDKLFATLDPTARRARLPDGRPVVLVDTVGFLRKLPTQLVAAFRATLEEVTEADALVHVLDVSHPAWERQRRAVEELLEELGADGKPTVLALNKTDRLPADRVAELVARTGGVPISALRRTGLEELLARVAQALPGWPRTRLRIPYAQAGLLAELRRGGRVLREEYHPDAVHVEAELPWALLSRLKPWAAT
ncbi:MAG: GTPase HflX [Armatimonadota bacterium]|nr:GTPase HflX [Armatimonadota bacterium]MDR7477132.1 GTPase HflX [Armatimonadota bacterium]